MVGERLAELRIKKNMTQEEFADYMGVTRQSVSKWELDKAFPDVEKLIRISELYDVSIDYILKGVLPEEKESVEAGNGEEKEEENVQTKTKVTKGKRGFIVSLCITAVFTLVTFVFLVFCLVQQDWLGRERQTPVRVDKVYSQLSFAEVSFYDNQGEYVSEKIFLDVEGVRPGDYIYTYVNDDNIFVSYGAELFFVSGILVILPVIMLMLQIKELGRHE